IHEDRRKTITEDVQESIRLGMARIKDNLAQIDVKVIFNSEVIKEVLSSKEFALLIEHIEPFEIHFKSITVHVTDEDFSNFSLTDNELVQPSFDPTNILIGVYVSRNKNIYQIFNDKFDEIFEKGIPINQFLSQNEEMTITTLSESQTFVLCVM
ncbi:MAG: hypothetical protein ACXACB_10140, partial [Promethearchaeota archaeon]